MPAPLCAVVVHDAIRKAPILAYSPSATINAPAMPLVKKRVARALATPEVILTARAMGHNHVSCIKIWTTSRFMHCARPTVFANSKLSAPSQESCLMCEYSCLHSAVHTKSLQDVADITFDGGFR